MPSATSGNRTLYAGRLRWLAIAALSLTFAAAGLFLAQEDTRRGLTVAGFFGLIGLGAAAMAVYGRASLQLSEDGFVLGRLWRDAVYRWQDVSAFRIVVIQGNRRVAFDVAHERGILATLARNQFGVSTVLPDGYGMPAEELTDLLNAWRIAALERATSP